MYLYTGTVPECFERSRNGVSCLKLSLIGLDPYWLFLFCFVLFCYVFCFLIGLLLIEFRCIALLFCVFVILLYYLIHGSYGVNMISVI